MAVLELMARCPGWWKPEKSKNCLGKLPPFVQLYVLEADHEGQAVTDDPVLEIEQ